MRQEATLAFAIGLGACLLFQIQFLLARQVLPWFGGAPAVWSTSLVVFQALLLAGYSWAHGLARLRSRRLQAALQIGLVVLALALLARQAAGWPSPVMPGDGWKPAGDEWPVVPITTLLLASIGVPFLALASTSSLLQRWHADGALSRGQVSRSPYRWYAVSNAGSLAGLLSYPLVIEPRLDLFQQGRWWTAGFVAFAAAMLLCAGFAWRSTPVRSQTEAPREDLPQGEPTSGARLPLIFMLAAVPAALLQATTTVLTQDIAAVPFLWMVPLALYLLTYIIAFERPRACPRTPLACLLIVVSLLSVWRWPTWPMLFLTLVTLAIAGLALHGELARRAPATSRLTGYYLTIAAGGVAGSALVALGAPLVFTRVVEYPVCLIAALFLLALSVNVDRETSRDGAHTEGAVRPRAGGDWAHHRRLLTNGLILAALLLVASTAGEARLIADQVTHASRSFFGTVRVREMTTVDGTRYRRLIHGTTLHGLQCLDLPKRREPLAYFTPHSGIGRAMTAITARPEPVRAVVLGLGIGTLAAYGRAGDRFTFIEIDPQIVALSTGSNPVFTYLRDTPASVNVIVGDGRLALERTPPLDADIVVADAFASDAVPVHLLTREAVAQYIRHLRPNGLIAMNVTNRYLALADVVAASAAANGLAVVRVRDNTVSELVRSTDWMLLARDRATLAEFEQPFVTQAPAWTDAWSDPWRAFHW